MTEVRISDDALDDLDEGFWFYETQEPGLGDHFARHLVADIDGLKGTAGIHKKDRNGYHRVVSKKFPYAIYYTLVEDRALVLAVIDCRRSPDWIRERLQS